MDRLVKDFWAIYADTMSLLLSAIKINDLPQLEYLLEEDVDIIGFRPLQEVQLQRKPSISEAFMRRIMHGDVGLTWVSSGVEMRCRIRDFLEDCLELAENDVRSTYPPGPNGLANKYVERSYQFPDRRKPFHCRGRLDRLFTDQTSINETFKSLSMP